MRHRSDTISNISKPPPRQLPPLKSRSGTRRDHLSAARYLSRQACRSSSNIHDQQDQRPLFTSERPNLPVRLADYANRSVSPLPVSRSALHRGILQPTAAFRRPPAKQESRMSTKSVCDLWISMWMIGQPASQVPPPPQCLLFRHEFFIDIKLIGSVRSWQCPTTSHRASS